MGQQVSVPGIDTTKPNTARVYDYLLGGKDNFAADREQAEKILQIDPRAAETCRENRGFVTRAVTWAAGQGISQFLDLGAGLPTSPSVHESAREVIPSARVCYVDHDPVAVVHASALLATSDGVAATQGDLADPDAVFSDPKVTGVIYPGQPACVIFAAVLHFYDPEQARKIIGEYVSRLATGSVVAVSTIRVDDPKMWEQHRAYTAATLYNHSREELASFFDGLELVPPGLASAWAWRGGMPTVPSKPPGTLYNLAAVGIKRA
jgi:O-methyltransferase involved in polyketide biosynthesis